ncbi:MAG: penicillin acylase family protein [Deltaproteobacteria bacterium]|nr:MAG: penicillin acylase family protein [Deltaproteobacteria bacterium]
MRSMFVAVWMFAAVACGTSAGLAPSLTITPSGLTAPITQPTVFTAVLVNSTDDVTWMATGGTLSDTAGLHVTYTPPAGTAMGTLTATAGKLSATVQIPSEPPGKTIPGLTAPVTVRYDAQDVPHLSCAAAADCVAVQGYLQARDRWFPMDFIRHVARSRLSEMIGVLGLSQDVQLRTLFITRDGKRLEGELTKALDAPTKALLDAFTAGVNAYLAELRAGKGRRTSRTGRSRTRSRSAGSTSSSCPRRSMPRQRTGGSPSSTRGAPTGRARSTRGSAPRRRPASRRTRCRRRRPAPRRRCRRPAGCRPSTWRRGATCSARRRSRWPRCTTRSGRSMRTWGPTTGSSPGRSRRATWPWWPTTRICRCSTRRCSTSRR